MEKEGEMTTVRLDQPGAAQDIKGLVPPTAGARLSAADCFVVVVDDTELAFMVSNLLPSRGAAAVEVRAGSQTLAALITEVTEQFKTAPPGKQLVLLSDRDMGSGRVGEELIAGVQGALPGASIHGIVFSGGVSKQKLAGDHNHLDNLAHIRATIGKPTNLETIVATIERVVNTPIGTPPPEK